MNLDFRSDRSTGHEYFLRHASKLFDDRPNLEKEPNFLNLIL
jgi:hypothetical protein